MSNRQPPMAVAGVGAVGNELTDLATAVSSAASALVTLEPIAALGRLEDLTPLIEASRFQLVRSARVSDTSWSRIAEAMDLTEDQAEAHFGRVDELIRAG